MKTKITILTLVIALFGFTAANAQGKGHGKNKAHKDYEKAYKKNKKSYERDVIYRDRNRDDYYRKNKRVIYRGDGNDQGEDWDDDYRVYRRSGNVYYPNRNVRNLPPGQAKKIYGHQSAKAFAPGQQKKAYKNVYYPQRRAIVNDRRYDDDFYRQRQQGEVARRIGSIFGL